MITQLIEQKTGPKRFLLIMDDGRKFKFGFRTGSTFIDHGDITKKNNYLKRHLSNKTEYELIKNLVPSPALFSALLLWGPYTNIKDNVNHLNSLFKLKHKTKK
jgi:hypothetical protein